MSQHHAPRHTDVHLTEVVHYKIPAEVKALIRKDLLNGKGYDACHQMLRKESGIWIPELDQVFKDLDKLLGLPAYKG